MSAGGSTSGGGSAGGNGSVDVVDIANLNIAPAWPSRISAACSNFNSFFNPTTGYPKDYDDVGNAGFPLCARRVGLTALKKPLSNITYSNFLNACSGAGAGTSLCPANVNRHNGTFREVHNRTDSQSGSDQLTTTAGTPVAMVFRVYRYIPDATGTLTQQTSPIFERRVPTPYSDDGSSPVGGNRCVSVTGPYTVAPDRCISQSEWWYGGDGARSSNVYSSRARSAGPLMGRTTVGTVQSDRETSCQAGWRDQRSKLAQMPYGYGNDYDRNGRINGTENRGVVIPAWNSNSKADLVSYIRQATVSNAAAANMTACMWNLGGSYPWVTYSTDGARRAPAKIDSNTLRYSESVAVAWRINNGPTSSSANVNELYFRIVGRPSAMYLVQWSLIDRDERILGGQVHSFVSVPGTGGCSANCGGGTNTIDPVAGSRTSKYDETATPIDVGSGTRSEPIATVEFPQMAAYLASPDEVSTGKAGTWSMVAQPLLPLSDYQALWPTTSNLDLVEPQAKNPDWSLNLSDSPFRPSFFRASQSGRTSSPVNYTMIGEWPIDAYVAGSQRTTLSFTSTPTFEPGADYPSALWRGSYTSASLLPSYSQTKPIMGNGTIIYESGRFVNVLGSPRYGFRTDRIRARDSYTLPGDVAGSETAVGATLIAQGECSKGGGPTGGLPCARLTVRTSNPGALRRVEIAPASNPAAVTRTIQGSAISFAAAASDGLQPGNINFTAAQLPANKYVVKLVFDSASARASTVSWGVSFSQWADLRDRWDWAGVSSAAGLTLGPDNDPFFGLRRAGGSVACPSGSCATTSDYSNMRVLGNQPGQ